MRGNLLFGGCLQRHAREATPPVSAVKHGGRRQWGETYVAESGKHPPKTGGCAGTQGVDQHIAAGRAEPARSGGEARRNKQANSTK